MVSNAIPPTKKKITIILMGILTDFPMSISEQAKLAYVRLRSMKCSHEKISFSLFLPYYSLIIIALN